MAKKSRRIIIEKLIERLSTITVANGYTNDICKVTMNLDNYQEKAAHEVPIIYVLPKFESSTGGVGGRYERKWEIDLLLVTKRLTQEEMLDIVDDVESALLGFKGTQSPSLDCNILLTRVTDFAMQGQMLADEDDHALGLITLELLYINAAHRV